MSFVHSFWAYLHWFSYLFTWCTSCAYYIHNVPTKIMLSLYVFSWQSNFHKTMNNQIENKYWRLLSHLFHVKTSLKFHWVDSQIIRGLTQQSENKYAHLKWKTKKIKWVFLYFHFNFGQKTLILDLTISRFSRLIFPWEISRLQISRFPVSREEMQCLV